MAACGGADPAGPDADASTTPAETEPDDELCATLRELKALKAEIWATEDLLDLSEAEVEQLAGTLDDAHRALEVVRTSVDADYGPFLEGWQQLYAALAQGYRTLDFDLSGLDDPDTWAPFEEAWSLLTDLSGDEFEDVADAFVDEMVGRCGFVPFAANAAVDELPASAPDSPLRPSGSSPAPERTPDQGATDHPTVADVPQAAVQFVALAAEQSPRRPSGSWQI